MIKSLPLLLTLLSLVAHAQQPLFKANGFFPHTEQFNELKSADLNGDGLKDLVLVTGHQMGVMVYWNLGNGQFEQAEQRLHISAAHQVLIEDFDGDGDLDLWGGTINQGGTFVDYSQGLEQVFNQSLPTITIPDTTYQLLINDGGGHFQFQNTGLESLRRFGNQRFKAHDLDQDGDQDVVTFSQLGNEPTDMYLFRNNGQAQFTQTRINLELLGFVVLADYNNDGAMDIWTKGGSISTENTQTLIIYLNDGQGGFNQEHHISADVGGVLFESINELLIDDINGDGKADVVILSGDKTISLIQQTDGTFIKKIQVYGFSIQAASLINFNGDEFLDILITANGQKGTKILLNQNGDWQLTEHEIPSSYAKQSVIDDFDQDDEFEVVTVGRLGLQYWQNNDGEWQEVLQQADVPTWASKRLVATADMNGDGHVDLMVAGASGAYFRAGNGRGAFAELQTITQYHVYNWAWSDVNQDGLSDLMVNSEQGTFLIVNKGPEGFADALIINSNEDNYFTGLVVQDLNHDSTVDMVVMVPEQGLFVYNYSASGLKLISELSGDFDGVFVFDHGAENYSLMVSNGFLSDNPHDVLEYKLTNEGFEFERSVFNNSGVYNPITSSKPWVFDFDKDGDNDLLFNQQTDGFGGFLMLVNQEQGFEVDTYQLPYAIAAFPSAIGDFNLDGDIDFIAPLRFGLVGWQDTVLLNDGDDNNNLWEQQTIDKLPLLSRLHTADIDADGDLDLISLNSDFFAPISSGGVSTFINTTNDRNFSGLWFNPDQSGHGLQLEQIEVDGSLAVNFSWFAFHDGKPFWLVGLAPIDGNSVSIPVSFTSGGDFGQDFDPDSVVRHPWGQVDLVLGGNEMSVSWQTSEPGFTGGNMSMQRLAVTKATSPVVDVLNSCHSGSWYNPDQSGHGFFINVIENQGEEQMTLAWYHYLDGKQKWLVAQGPVLGTTALLSAQSASGSQFPPDFESTDVVYNEWGQITFTLLSNTEAKITWSGTTADFPSGELLVEKLTQLDRYHCN